MNLFAVGTAFLLGLYVPVGTIVSLGLYAAKLPWWPEGQNLATLLVQLLVYALDFGMAALAVRYWERRFGLGAQLPHRFPGRGAIVAGLWLCGAYMLVKLLAFVVPLEHAPTFVFIAAALAVPLATLLVAGGMLRAAWSVRRGRGGPP